MGIRGVAREVLNEEQAFSHSAPCLEVSSTQKHQFAPLLKSSLKSHLFVKAYSFSFIIF